MIDLSSRKRAARKSLTLATDKSSGFSSFFFSMLDYSIKLPPQGEAVRRGRPVVVPTVLCVCVFGCIVVTLLQRQLLRCLLSGLTHRGAGLFCVASVLQSVCPEEWQLLRIMYCWLALCLLNFLDREGKRRSRVPSNRFPQASRLVSARQRSRPWYHPPHGTLGFLFFSFFSLSRLFLCLLSLVLLFCLSELVL